MTNDHYDCDTDGMNGADGDVHTCTSSVGDDVSVTSSIARRARQESEIRAVDDRDNKTGSDTRNSAERYDDSIFSRQGPVSLTTAPPRRPSQRLYAKLRAHSVTGGAGGASVAAAAGQTVHVPAVEMHEIHEPSLLDREHTSGACSGTGLGSPSSPYAGEEPIPPAMVTSSRDTSALFKHSIKKGNQHCETAEAKHKNATSTPSNASAPPTSRRLQVRDEMILQEGSPNCEATPSNSHDLRANQPVRVGAEAPVAASSGGVTRVNPDIRLMNRSIASSLAPDRVSSEVLVTAELVDDEERGGRAGNAPGDNNMLVIPTVVAEEANPAGRRTRLALLALIVAAVAVAVTVSVALANNSPGGVSPRGTDPGLSLEPTFSPTPTPSTEVHLKYPNCTVELTDFVADGKCDNVLYLDSGAVLDGYNTVECGWDGGDCVGPCGIGGGTLTCEEKYPDCNIADPSRVGDGICHGGDYNSRECGWDGGDCFSFNSMYPNCWVNSPSSVGDGHCDHGAYGTEECEWDGGDCPSEGYPDCDLGKASTLGDGNCELKYFSEECAWDGGDCSVKGYPDCHVDEPSRIGDGECDDGATLYNYYDITIDYNTEECGWDGGDCV